MFKQIKTIMKILTFPFFALLVTAISSFSLGWMASNLYTNPKYISLEVSRLKGHELDMEKCWADSIIKATSAGVVVETDTFNSDIYKMYRNCLAEI